MNDLQQRLLRAGPVLDALCQAMRREAATLFAREPVWISAPGAAVYRLQHDRADDTESLVGEWFDPQGHRLGMLICHAGGHCFAEHDIVRAHPHDRRWFVEAVEAWGQCEVRRGDDPLATQAAAPILIPAEIHAEIRMLPQP